MKLAMMFTSFLYDLIHSSSFFFPSPEEGFHLGDGGSHRFLKAAPAPPPSGAGIYSGVDILAQPISLFFVQATIIIGLCRFLSLAGIYLKEPSVVFEIVAGILLGPSGFCRNDYFFNNIFPLASLKNLQIVATIGLTFYLFTVGMEMDIKLLKTHFKKTSLISLAGIAVPFAVGIGVSNYLRHVLQPESNVKSSSFFVFIGTAMSITAFPVLARMLKEGGLIYTRPGSMALGAAAVDDAIAWTLLALSIAIANGGSMHQAGYIFATVVLIASFQMLIMKPILEFLVEYAEVNRITIITNNLFALMICLLFMFAWITEFIGLDTIFGAFLFGLTVPRNTRLFHQCREYVESFVLTFTLPLYFAISGLKTDITTIRSHKDGAMVVLVCVLASAAKFSGVGFASYFSGLNLRESTTVAALMNTRGLVELIVLNVGLSAKILTTRTFSVMVLMALFTTFITSPIVELVFPEKYRLRGSSALSESSTEMEMVALKPKATAIGPLNLKSLPNRLGVVVESLPQMQFLIKLLGFFLPRTNGSELTATIMHFHEPTKSNSDTFIGLNEEGRIIRVDEEPTDLSVALSLSHNDPSIKKPELLPISSFCKAFDIPVNAFRIEGEFTEYRAELNSIASNNECTLLCIPFKDSSSFAENLFWSSLKSTSAPVLLVAEVQPPHEREVVTAEPQRRRSRTGSFAAMKAELIVDLESGLTNTDAPTLYSSVPADALPIHRRRSVTNRFQKVDARPKRNNSIVALISGKPTDVIVLSILPRFLENQSNALTVLVAAEEEIAPAVKELLKTMKQDYKDTVDFQDIHGGTLTDIEGLVREISNYSYDLIISSFIDPKEDPSLKLLETSNALANAYADPEGFIMSYIGSRVEQPLERINRRKQIGMPENCVYSNLSHPELGVLGSRLYEKASSNPRLVCIIHDPLHCSENIIATSSKPENVQVEVNSENNSHGSSAVGETKL